jgi:hypothetical protein
MFKRDALALLTAVKAFMLEPLGGDPRSAR